MLGLEVISQAMNYIMGNEIEQMRLKCFERTGCLLTWTPHPLHDAKVKSQGMRDGLLQVPQVQTVNEQLDEVPLVGIDAEAAAIAEEGAFIAEIENDISLEMDNEIEGQSDEN